MSNAELAVSNKTVEGLLKQLREKEKGGLKFPANYSVENALNSAYLMLKEAENKDGKPLLSVCTPESVVQSLMQMATQGLNPVKKQCYFVAYGNKCQLVPSYFGTLAVLKRATRLKGEPVANIIYKGDEFEYTYDVETGEVKILKHEQKLENIDNNNILGVYAIVRTEEMKVVEIMNINQLQAAWGQGQAWQSAERKGGQSRTHTKFTEEMAKKTVLNRACKKLINSADDSSLMGDEAIGAYNETESNDALDVVAESVATDVEENAGSVEFEEIASESPPELVEAEEVPTSVPEAEF